MHVLPPARKDDRGASHGRVGREHAWPVPAVGRRVVPHERASGEVVPLGGEVEDARVVVDGVRRLVRVQDHRVARRASPSRLLEARLVLPRVRLHGQHAREGEAVLVRDGAPNPLDEPDEVEDRRGRALAAVVEVEALEVWEDLEVRLCGGGEGGEGDARASLAAGALLAAAALLERQVGVLRLVEDVLHAGGDGVDAPLLGGLQASQVARQLVTGEQLPHVCVEDLA
mmetsp:Transcript_35723/g.112229  ORF Transcript_35723/g.112229 Transcript_35723/m.112229 type:complete len:228 (+) Transcript_35723:645-1328(+)